MKYTAQQIADLLQGTVEGDANAEVWQLCKIEEGQPGGISFLANPKYTHYIYSTQASVVIVANNFEAEHPINATLVRVENPYLSFATLLKAYNSAQLDKKGIAPEAYISDSATIGNDCYVGPFAYIGENVKIGNNVKIYPHVYIGDNSTISDNTTLFAGVRLYHYTVIGQRCILHAGAVIGADGFGFAPREDGSYDKIDQIGNVVIEDDVEIGANTTIDRATMGSTIIHRGVKIDNLCQIAHNVQIGTNTAMAAQSGIAGSGKIGSNCVLAGQVGIVGHIEVGDRVIVAAQSGITNNIKSDQTILGSPAVEAHKQRRNYIYTRNMERLVARIEELEKQIKELKG
ncbi:MAG: UDP-3-O-(3-hydroxymyristoyl)glucosamine N-acyltransferase [Bacteroidales bacterium]|nr:UDP-3-O-(3-hydroxymyristoyl)glucosamine N-acyltransferase [Bacteroidales bacterium]